jgi:hypothetical protein
MQHSGSKDGCSAVKTTETELSHAMLTGRFLILDLAVICGVQFARDYCAATYGATILIKTVTWISPLQMLNLLEDNQTPLTVWWNQTSEQ